jgi:alpha-tubulin suppressor-like RCC1 family protein
VSCSRNIDGTVSCVGGNDSGQLGNGSSVDAQPHPTPQTVVGLTNVVAIAARFATVYAIDGAGHVWAWGLAINGALGVAASGVACNAGTCVPSPTRVPALDGTVAIAAAHYGGVALKNDGSVVAWGLNNIGILGHLPGDGDSPCENGPCRTTPVEIGGLPK